MLNVKQYGSTLFSKGHTQFDLMSAHIFFSNYLATFEDSPHDEWI